MAVAVQELRERTAAATALTEMQQGMRALEHVLRTAVDKRVSPEKLGAALRGLAAVDGAVYGALLPLWELAAPTLLGGDVQPMPLIPTVTDFDWRCAAHVGLCKVIVQLALALRWGLGCRALAARWSNCVLSKLATIVERGCACSPPLRRVGVTVQQEAGGSGEGDVTESYVEFQLHCVMPDGSKVVQPFQIPVNEFQDFAKEIDSLARVTSTL